MARPQDEPPIRGHSGSFVPRGNDGADPHRGRACQRLRGQESGWIGNSVVVDAAIHVGGIQIAEDLQGRRSLGLVGVALLERLKLLDLLSKLGGGRLFAFGLGLAQGVAIGLKLFSDAGHGTQPLLGTKEPGECNPDEPSPENLAGKSRVMGPWCIASGRSGHFAESDRDSVPGSGKVVLFCWMNSMADAPYLVALALVEFSGKRALPLTGKSQTSTAAEAADPGDDGRTLALELLLRLWQRSEEGALQRAAGDASLLLLELPLEAMSEQLPVLKANWLSNGETATLLQSLEGLAIRAWRITIAKYEPVSFVAWP